MSTTDYTIHQEILDGVAGTVGEHARQLGGVDVSTFPDAADALPIAASINDEMVGSASVRVDDPEAMALTVTFLDEHGCIVGTMSTSNMSTEIVSGAVSGYLGLI